MIVPPKKRLDRRRSRAARSRACASFCRSALHVRRHLAAVSATAARTLRRAGSPGGIAWARSVHFVDHRRHRVLSLSDLHRGLSRRSVSSARWTRASDSAAATDSKGVASVASGTSAAACRLSRRRLLPARVPRRRGGRSRRARSSAARRPPRSRRAGGRSRTPPAPRHRAPGPPRRDGRGTRPRTGREPGTGHPPSRCVPLAPSGGSTGASWPDPLPAFTEKRPPARSSGRRRRRAARPRRPWRRLPSITKLGRVTGTTASAQRTIPSLGESATRTSVRATAATLGTVCDPGEPGRARRRQPARGHAGACARIPQGAADEAGTASARAAISRAARPRTIAPRARAGPASRPPREADLERQHDADAEAGRERRRRAGQDAEEPRGFERHGEAGRRAGGRRLRRRGRRRRRRRRHRHRQRGRDPERFEDGGVEGERHGEPDRRAHLLARGRERREAPLPHQDAVAQDARREAPRALRLAGNLDAEAGVDGVALEPAPEHGRERRRVEARVRLHVVGARQGRGGPPRARRQPAGREQQRSDRGDEEARSARPSGRL